MSWLDTLLDRGNEPRQLEAPAPVAGSPSPGTLPAAPHKALPEIKSLWVQTHSPNGSTDPGGCAPAWYSVADGILTMHDENGNPTGQEHRLAPGDDERKIAGHLRLKAWSKEVPDFNRPLRYRPIGLA